MTIPINYPNPDNEFYWIAENVSEGNIYYYYVSAFNSVGEEIGTSNVRFMDLWMPECRPQSPLDGVTITEPTSTFEWYFTEQINFPYNDVYFSRSVFQVWDETLGERDKSVWNIELDEPESLNLSISYSGEPLIDGHNYRWEYWIYGENFEGTNSVCYGFDREFYYNP